MVVACVRLAAVGCRGRRVTLHGSHPLPPGSCYCVCTACRGQRCSQGVKQRAGEASLAAQNHMTCPGLPLPPEAWRNRKHPLRKGACIRMNPSRLSDHLQTIYQIDPLLGAGSEVAEAQSLRVGVLRYCQQHLH